MKTINTKDYFNYVFSFTDGTVKVGVTSRPNARLKELCRKKRGLALLKDGIFTAPSSKEKAFKTEADLCRLLGYMVQSGAREWFLDDRADFGFMTQTTGMFWNLNNGTHYAPVKVAL